MKADKEELRLAVTRSLFAIGTTAAVFSVLTGVLSIAALCALKMRDPLNTPALSVLYERLRENPEDRVLRDEIRELDLLARRAYFASRQQATTGGVLVFTGTAVFVIAFAVRELLYRRLPASPRDKLRPPPAASRLKARVTMAAAAVALFICAGVLVFVLAPLMDAFRLPAAGASAVPQDETAQAPSEEKEAGGAPAAGLEASWPSFRGPGGRPLAAPGDYPVDWDGASGRGVLWRAKPRLPGGNSPIVIGGRVFLSGADRNGAEVYGYNAETGALLFTAAAAFSPVGRRAKIDEQNVGWAAPTLAADATRLAGIFASGDVFCFNHDGKMLWRKHVGTPVLNYGFASSPIIWNGLLIIQYDDERKPRLLALDLATGETRWETKHDILSSWASPVFATSRGRAAIAISSNPLVAVYDAVAGTELWSADVMTGEIGSSPAFDDGIIYTGNETALLAAFTADDGKKLWEYYDDLPSVASPAVKDGLLFIASAAGVVTCLDAKSGTAVWREEYADGFYASPVIAGDAVYLTDRAGVTRIIKAARKYSLIASCALEEPVEATPAFINGRIYFRGKKTLYCIGK